jgi:hypothetical protein
LALHRSISSPSFEASSTDLSLDSQYSGNDYSSERASLSSEQQQNPGAQNVIKVVGDATQETTVANPALPVDGVQLEGSRVVYSDEMEEVCDDS